MARVTIKELEERLKNAQNLIDMQIDEISRLNKELDDTRNGLNVVSSAEFKGVISELENYKLLYKILKQQKEKEISSLKNKVDVLIDKIKEVSSEIKIEHNSRGAGRKEFQDYETVQHIFNLYANGESLQGVANKLNEYDIKTRAGGTWSKSSVRFILLNKSYVEKGIIDKDTFINVTERMKSK